LLQVDKLDKTKLNQGSGPRSKTSSIKSKAKTKLNQGIEGKLNKGFGAKLDQGIGTKLNQRSEPS